MRPPLLAVVATGAALAVASSAAADLQPIRRSVGEAETVPRLRAGTVELPAAASRGRVRVIVRLEDPPLAAAGRVLQSRSGTRRLDTSSRSARAYVARLTRAQNAAVASLKRAIPAAVPDRRYSVLLNGFAVTLPAKSLPRLAKLSFATRVYPSVRYTRALNESPSIIAAPEVIARTGARGDGMKIAVIDDGVDPDNAFFDPTGYAYPAGFPKGGTKWTTPKVIVARSFPGPGAGRRGRLAVDPRASFHGTHVAGIAAGNAGTTAPPGQDHPRTPGLTGVAPRAYIGNYRVFNVPTPIGNVANTPEIAAAFEQAVRDGMDVINFSGGGAQTEPENDAMFETIRNAVGAGVVVVASAGNDRDEFAFGSAGSPGVAEDAISVAATSNLQVFAPTLSVTAPGAPATVRSIPIAAGANRVPPAWGAGVTLVDVTTVVGAGGRPVDAKLCGTGGDPNGPTTPLPNGSLTGAVALVSRGDCTFASKAGRAQQAGAIGIVLVDNRPGEANGVPVALGVPAVMVADLDGQRLRAYLATTGGRAQVRITAENERVQTGRAGIITSFSSAGPTSFGHLLKPDVSAPGGQILSATLPIAGGPFAVFDGTSMSAPHVAGAAALLQQLHPTWLPRHVKSALMQTAGAAYANTARTEEAAVTLEGAGLVNLIRANDPKLFAEPASLSFGDLDVSRGAESTSLLVTLTDANGGGGRWTVELAPQRATTGVSIDIPAFVDVPPGGTATLAAILRGNAGAETGENYGFIVLRRGEEQRRIPYFTLVKDPALATYVPKELQFLQSGDTRDPGRVAIYRYPSAPFGPAPSYTGAAVTEPGGEDVYTILVRDPVANVGAAVVSMSGGARIDPWFLGSLDENDVQGYAGTPVNVNALTFGYRSWVGAAGASFPRPKRYYLSVDSGRDEFSLRPLPGQYLLRAWVNDVSPPFLQLLTRKVTRGRPLIAVRALDAQAGVDPFSIVIAYNRVLVGAVAYDPATGIALIPLPAQAPRFAKDTSLVVVASDYQEAKNINTTGPDIMPNTAARAVKLDVVSEPAVTWLVPEERQCVARRQDLLVTASAAGRIASVTWHVGGKRVAIDRTGPAGLFAGRWNTAGVAKGTHRVEARVTTRGGATARAVRTLRKC